MCHLFSRDTVLGHVVAGDFGVWTVRPQPLQTWIERSVSYAVERVAGVNILPYSWYELRPARYWLGSFTSNFEAGIFGSRFYQLLDQRDRLAVQFEARGRLHPKDTELIEQQ